MGLKPEALQQCVWHHSLNTHNHFNEYCLATIKYTVIFHLYLMHWHKIIQCKITLMTHNIFCTHNWKPAWVIDIWKRNLWMLRCFALAMLFQPLISFVSIIIQIITVFSHTQFDTIYEMNNILYNTEIFLLIRVSKSDFRFGLWYKPPYKLDA